MSHEHAVRNAITSVVMAASIATAAADETSIRLTEGPGLPQVQATIKAPPVLFQPGLVMVGK